MDNDGVVDGWSLGRRLGSFDGKMLGELDGYRMKKG
jgi:hypothetical protein